MTALNLSFHRQGSPGVDVGHGKDRKIGLTTICRHLTAVYENLIAFFPYPKFFGDTI
jgi:hypothetical protein